MPEEPELLGGNLIYLDAFFKLNKERQQGMSGAGPIPLVPIVLHAWLEQMSPWILRHRIGLCDEVYFEWIKSQAKEPEKAKPVSNLLIARR